MLATQTCFCSQLQPLYKSFTLLFATPMTAHAPSDPTIRTFSAAFGPRRIGISQWKRSRVFREDLNATGAWLQTAAPVHHFSSNVQPSWKGMEEIKPRRVEQKQSAPLCTYRVQLLVCQAVSFDSCITDITFDDIWCHLTQQAISTQNVWFPAYICILYSDTKHNWRSGNRNLDNTRAKHQLPRDERHSKNLSWQFEEHT